MTTPTDPQLQISRPFEHEVVVLLVDDQPIIGEAVRRMLLTQPDIRFHFCSDAKLAIQTATEVQPTVILQDLVMPDIDGLDLVPQYRQTDATRETPLIVLSTKEEADTKAEAFARGANDYLVKLPDPVELIARIRYHSRGYIALLERRAAYEALARSEQALRDELSQAARYVQSLLPRPLRDPVQVSWTFIPSAALGGDSFDYQWLDDDHFAICLIDVCGHGVGSALLSVSVLNALRSRNLAETDFTDPASVMRSINRAYPMERHNSMFFTMWYGVYQRSTRQLRYAGGGHPPALCVTGDDASGTELKELPSNGPLVGIDDDSEFPADELRVSPGDELYLYSDGVFEVPTPDGSMWTYSEFREFMRTPPTEAGKVENLMNFTRQLQGKDDYGDDFSMIRVTFP